MELTTKLSSAKIKECLGVMFKAKRSGKRPEAELITYLMDKSYSASVHDVAYITEVFDEAWKESHSDALNWEKDIRQQREEIRRHRDDNIIDSNRSKIPI